MFILTAAEIVQELENMEKTRMRLEASKLSERVCYGLFQYLGEIKDRKVECFPKIKTSQNVLEYVSI